MTIDIEKTFKKLKCGPTRYKENVHCKLLLKIMSDPAKGRLSAFCKEVLISDTTFYNWVKTYPLFAQCYGVAQIFARELWENEGMELRDRFTPPGTIDHGFEYWKMIGWSRFGISKNSRIKLELNPEDNPSQHYAQLLKQAASGSFTAAEIKQLMEAVNVGLNTHQVFELQKQIDELKSDLSTMNENSNVQNTFTNKGIAQKD